MKYLAILGREPQISLAELEALFENVKKISPSLAEFNSKTAPNIDRLGGSLKLAEKLSTNPLDFLSKLPDGKLTIGISDYSAHSSKKSATLEALKLKKILTRHGRSVRVVENKSAALSTATSLHNGLSGKNERKVELIKANRDWYKVIGVQNIDAYSRRDQTRPARDAKVGMLPPKLAQILINLCGPLPEGSRILDPFCGTGVVLQEAILMGYTAYGTDLSEKMVAYSEKNLEWLISTNNQRMSIRGSNLGLAPLSASRDGTAVADQRMPVEGSNLGLAPLSASRDGHLWSGHTIVSLGDATSFKWQPPIDAIACEGYLGKPMSQPPSEIKLKTEKQECQTIILGFLKNLASQIKPNTPVIIAIPAWLRTDGTYSRLKILDEIEQMGYNVNNKTREGLLYYREKQIVARDIIILRKS